LALFTTEVSAMRAIVSPGWWPRGISYADMQIEAGEREIILAAVPDKNVRLRFRRDRCIVSAGEETTPPDAVRGSYSLRSSMVQRAASSSASVDLCNLLILYVVSGKN
jgi:hypothetical protein